MVYRKAHIILNKEQSMDRNLALAESHLLEILERPELLDSIPEDAYVVLLPTDDQELFESNLALANRLIRRMSPNESNKPITLVLLPVDNRVPVFA